MSKPVIKILKPTGLIIKPQNPGQTPAAKPTPPLKPVATPKPATTASAKTSTSFPSPEELLILRRYTKATADELGRVLGVISGMLSFSAESGETDLLLHTTNEAIGVTEYALTLTRNLSFLNSPLKLEPRMTDVSQLIVDTYVLFEKYLAALRIQPNCLVENSAFIAIDPNAMHQVVSNLMARAGRTMRSGGQLTIALKQTDSETEITYTDSGHPHVSATEDLDLEVARILVEAHRGTLNKKAKAGGGNCVVITLPRDASPQPTGALSKRRTRRAAVTLPVDYWLEQGGMVQHSVVVNLSLGGAFISVPHPERHPEPKVGQEISLKIHCFLSNALDIPRARVTNVRWTGNQPGFGVEFIDADNKTRKILAGVVKSHTY